MRPLRLEIDGLRSYRAKSTIDFTDRNLCAVVGDTGAGKSSILEAMVFALYGGSTFTKQAGSLVCDARDQMRVALNFEADGRRWRVERVMWHREASTKPSAHKLDELDADGSLVRTISDKRRIEPLIEQLIGLDRDAFLKSVLLPQGRFAELLTATPAVRSDILKRIFALDDLEQCAEEIRLLAGQAGTAMQVVRVRRADLGEDPAASAAAAAATESRATAALEAIDEVVSRVHDASAAAAEAESGVLEQGRLAAVIDGVLGSLQGLAGRAGFEGRSADEAFDAVEQTRHAITEDIAAATEAEAEARAQQARITEQLATREVEGLGQSDLARLRSSLTQLPKLAARWAAAVTERAGLESTRGTTVTDLATAEGEATAAATDRDAAESALAEERQQAIDARDRLAEAARRVDQAVAAMKKERTTAAEADRLRTAAATAEEAAEKAQEEVDSAETALRAAREHERHAVTADHAAAVAAGLSAGETCPVCTSVVPADFTPPQPVEAVQQAAARVEGAESLCTAVRTAHRQAVGTASGTRSKAEACDKAHRESVADGETAMAQLRDLLPTVTPDDLQDRATPTTPDPVALRDDPLLGALAAAVRPVDEAPVAKARTRAELAAAAVQRLQQSLEETTRGIDRCTKQTGSAAEELLRTTKAVPARFAPPALAGAPALLGEEQPPADRVDAYAALDVSAALQAVDAELTATQQLDADRATAATAIDKAVSRCGAAERRTADEVSRPLAAMRTDLQVAAAKLRDLPDVEDPGAVPDGDDVEGLRTHTASVIRTAEAAREAVARARASAQERAGAQHREVVRIVRTLMPDVELPDEELPASAPAVVAQVARRALDDHVVALRTDAAVAGREAKRLAGLAEQAAVFDVAIAQADPLVRALETLKGLLTRGRFIGHVVQQRQLHLLGVATERLREMTEGRYGFTAEFDLLDNLTGRARGADTLSGGEKFLASLALALAMVEMAGRAGGKIDAIFLDEGFGALDSDSLDEALDLLEAQAADGRLLVVISHIKAVAERIQSVLHVTNDATGASSAYWLTDQQRAAFVHDEADNAVSGLLA